MKDVSMLPKFRYHPNVYDNQIVTFEKGKCQCCEKEVEVFVNSMYSKENVNCICMECVANGSAAEKFNGSFIQDADKRVSDDEKVEELFKRTPGYVSWQGEHWLTCCDDYCQFIGDVGIKELDEIGITDEVINEYEEKTGLEVNRDYLQKAGHEAGYLFKCEHCNKYHIWVDRD